MKLTVFIITIFSCNFLLAGEWSDRISIYLEAYEKSAEDTKPIAYPRLSERISNAFLVNKNSHVNFEVLINGDIHSSTDLYYTEGALVIYQQTEGWNLVTKGDYVYEWKRGDAVGIKIKKNETHLVDYILYLTDPTYLMTSLFYNYNSNPKDYLVKDLDDKPYKQIVLEEPVIGIESIFVNLESLWFHGFAQSDPESEESRVFYIHEPQEYQSVPPYIDNEMNTVEFEESDTTLRRHMVYL